MSMESKVTADEILTTAAGHLAERAKRYDKNGTGGERSIPKTVTMFKQLTGIELTNEQGWLFMVCLKLVRSQQCGAYHADSYEDACSYVALAGESANERMTTTEK